MRFTNGRIPTEKTDLRCDYIRNQKWLLRYSRWSRQIKHDAFRYRPICVHAKDFRQAAPCAVLCETPYRRRNIYPVNANGGRRLEHGLLITFATAGLVGDKI